MMKKEKRKSMLNKNILNKKNINLSYIIMNGLNPIEFNNLNGLMEIYADNLNTLKINNLEIDESLTLSGNITANNLTITPTNISYCDATSSIQTQINNLSQQLYTTTGGGFYELLFETTLLTYSGTYNGYIFGMNQGQTYGYYIGTAVEWGF